MTHRSRLPFFALVIVALFFGVVPSRAAGHLDHGLGRARAANHLNSGQRRAGAAGPKAYYLSLGDSLAFGYQPYPPIRSGFGFYDFLAAALERINPELQPVNFGCPGESSATFINGGCPAASAVAYKGSQLDAALAFLKAHNGQVSPITYVLGANDILPALATGDPAKIQGAIGQFAANDDAILKQLRAAAPAADIVTIDYYQPLAVAVTSTAALSNVVQVSQAGNSVIDQVAAKYNVKVANVYSVFNTPAQNPLLCSLTWICSPYHDIHPMIAGYAIMTGLLEATLGYPGFASTTVTNPLAVSRAIPVAPSVLTWAWIGDSNAQGYDVIVYHYDTSGNAIQDRSETVPAGTHSYTLVGTTCGITYELKVRSRGPNRPNQYFTPGDGRGFPCPA